MHEATVRRAGQEILSNVDLEVPAGARAVVVGPNGCGKTTLLTTIAAQDPVEGGYLDVRASSVGWLRQEAIGGSMKTVYQEAVAQMPAMLEKQKMEAAHKAFSDASGASDAEILKKQAAYEEAKINFEAAGGKSIETKIEDVLTGLGFSRADFKKPCSELSGGWQMRVALARALLREPELLLLDEPTNHMDAAAKNWLATYLARGLPRTSTLLLVTHDRFLLEEMRCTQVYEIAERCILRYDVSGINEWEKDRERRVALLQKEMVKIQKSMELDEDYVRRFGAKSSHAKQAQSRKKRIAKAQKELEELRAQTRGLPSASVLNGEDSDEEDDKPGLLPLAGPGKVKFKLPEWPLGASPPLDRKLLTLKETEIRYEGGEPVLNVEEFVVSAGQRLALLGPNGCGKTTLLRSLAGRLEVSLGSRILGVGALRRARVAFFTQDLAQDLPGDITPVEHVLGDDAPIYLDEEGARAALGALGLRGACHNAPIKTLSGGEKARVALAVFATRPADVLLLDEPTNHLDGAAVASLCAGLREHSGAVLVSSHDKAFLEALRVTDQVHIVRKVGEPGQLKVVSGPVERQFGGEKRRPRATAGASAHVAQVELPGPAKAAAKPSANKAMLTRKISSVMRRIETAEGLLAEAAEAMSAEYNEETLAAYEAANANVEKEYEIMQSLEDQLATC